jgi:hypothetical protein
MGEKQTPEYNLMMEPHLTNIGKKVKIMKREVQEVKTEVTTKLLDG